MRPMVMKRLKALFIDWLYICGYLIVLALVMFALYLFIFQGIPEFTAIQSQLVAAFTTVIPVIAVFTWMEAQTTFATRGKREFGLRLNYRGNPWRSALIRNILKFLPWQLAHMSVIDGMYNGWESPLTMVIYLMSIFLALTYVMQVVVTPSHRHLPDLVAGARVIRLPD